MHEVSIMEDAIALAIERAIEQQATRIHRLVLRIGAQSGVVPEALRFAFDITIAGTIAQEATLEIEIIPVICQCPQCQKVFQPEDIIYECPDCGSICSQTRQGREIELASLEVS